MSYTRESLAAWWAEQDRLRARRRELDDAGWAGLPYSDESAAEVDDYDEFEDEHGNDDDNIGGDSGANRTPYAARSSE